MKKSINKRRAGFTLAESIIAIAVLALFALAIVPVTTVIFNSKHTMVEVNKCQMLASNILLTVADEIRYGQNVRIKSVDGEETIVVDSATYGSNASFTLKDGKIKAGSDGQYDLLSDKYYGTLRIDSFVFTQVPLPDDGGAAAPRQGINIKITVGGISDLQYTADITVEALNGVQ